MTVKNKRMCVFAVFALLTVLWMLVIFGFSANDAEQSTVQSNAVTEFVLRIFNWDFDKLSHAEQQELISHYDGIIRKLAHFAAYAVLGFLMYFSVGSVKSLPDELYRHIMISLPICILFAISDEYHQTFVGGRAGKLTDVLIDGGGAVCGTAAAIFAVMYIMCIRKKKNV